MTDRGKIDADDWEMTQDSFTIKRGVKENLFVAYAEIMRIHNNIFALDTVFGPDYPTDRHKRASYHNGILNTSITDARNIVKFSAKRKFTHPATGKKTSESSIYYDTYHDEHGNPNHYHYQSIDCFKKPGMTPKKEGGQAPKSSKMAPSIAMFDEQMVDGIDTLVPCKMYDLLNMQDFYIFGAEYKPSDLFSSMILSRIASIAMIPVQWSRRVNGEFENCAAGIYLGVDDILKYVENRWRLSSMYESLAKLSGVDAAIKLFFNYRKVFSGCTIVEIHNPAYTEQKIPKTITHFDFKNVSRGSHGLLTAIRNNIVVGEGQKSDPITRELLETNVINNRVWFDGLCELLNKEGGMRKVVVSRTEKVGLGKIPLSEFEAGLTAAIHYGMKCQFGEASEYDADLTKLWSKWDLAIRQANSPKEIIKTALLLTRTGTNNALLSQVSGQLSDLARNRNNVDYFKNLFTLATRTYIGSGTNKDKDSE